MSKRKKDKLLYITLTISTIELLSKIIEFICNLIEMVEAFKQALLTHQYYTWKKTIIQQTNY